MSSLKEGAVDTDMFTAKAMIHSLKAQDEAVILHEKGSNDVIAE